MAFNLENKIRWEELSPSLQDKFKQLLIISHIQEVKDMFRESVEIIKINGISKINELR